MNAGWQKQNKTTSNKNEDFYAIISTGFFTLRQTFIHC